VKNVVEFEGKIMYPSESSDITLEKYRSLEIEFHIDLMKICRRYISELGIVSIIGILDIVKQETIELEGATKRDVKAEDFEAEKAETKVVSPSENRAVEGQRPQSDEC